MQTRKPAVAGQFYPDSESECRDLIADCLANRSITNKLPENIAAGIVPHAGWIFSGDLAAMVFNAILKTQKTIDTFVIFGTTHRYFDSSCAVCDKGNWQTPMGKIMIDEELAQAIIKKNNKAKSNPQAHNSEHSIEVQVPFIQYLFKDAKIVPILTPPTQSVISVGNTVAECIKSASDKKIICIGSTDLTHYGPGYGFNHQGIGQTGIDWARNVNDKAFINLAIEMKAQRILTESMENQNACGPGAAAATISAAAAMGKTKGVLLAQTNSSEVMERKFGETSNDSVGYAAIVF